MQIEWLQPKLVYFSFAKKKTTWKTTMLLLSSFLNHIRFWKFNNKTWTFRNCIFKRIIFNWDLDHRHFLKMNRFVVYLFAFKKNYIYNFFNKNMLFCVIVFFVYFKKTHESVQFRLFLANEYKTLKLTKTYTLTNWNEKIFDGWYIILSKKIVSITSNTRLTTSFIVSLISLAYLSNISTRKHKALIVFYY